MSYNPQEPIARDAIRRMAGDIDDPEWLTDATYDAVIMRHGVPVTGWDSTAAFYRSAAELLRSVAVAIENDPSSYTSTGDFSASWSDRTRSLRDAAKWLDAQAADADSGDDGAWGAVTVRSNFLMGSDGSEEW